MTRRILFVKLPHFAVERFIKTNRQKHIRAKPFWDAPIETKAQREEGSKTVGITKDGPIVLVQEGAKGTRISALGLEAEREGLWRGMTLNDARAMVPNLRVEPHDVEADRIALSKMALWMQRYSPAVAIETGFASTVAFSCAFRQVMAMTPSMFLGYGAHDR